MKTLNEIDDGFVQLVPTEITAAAHAINDWMSMQGHTSRWTLGPVCSRDHAELVAKNAAQAERIRVLEGATNHAGGTPLNKAINERDDFRVRIAHANTKIVALMQERDKFESQRDIARSQAQAYAENYSQILSRCSALIKAADAMDLLLTGNRTPSKHVRDNYQAAKNGVALTPAWKPPASAPKDRVILADIGYPWPMACLWDAGCSKWAVASLNIENKDASGHSLNVWWASEYEPQLKSWMEIPSLPSPLPTSP